MNKVMPFPRKDFRAMTLVELIIGLCLLSLVVIPMFGIIPTAYMAIKKAEDYSAASCYAQEIIELYRYSDPCIAGSFHNEMDVTLNGTDYRVVVDLHGRDVPLPTNRLMDAVVNMYWKKMPEHISVFSRINYNLQVR